MAGAKCLANKIQLATAMLATLVVASFAVEYPLNTNTSILHITTEENTDGFRRRYDSSKGELLLNVSQRMWSRMLISAVEHPNKEGITSSYIKELVHEHNNTRKNRPGHHKRAESLRNSLRHRSIENFEPMSEIKLRNMNASALHINWHWRITDLNGKLRLPSSPVPKTGKQYKLIVDVGLHYGAVLHCELWNDPDLVYIGIEAHLVNFGVSHYHMLENVPLGDPMRDRIMLLPLGLSNVTANVPFNENYAPACGSILKSIGDRQGWWCTHTINSFEIPVVRLDSILARVPANYTFHYLKVDVEGADHLVIYGGGEYISKFNMITIECRPPNDAIHTARYDTCQQSEMLHYMTSRGFDIAYCDVEDCHFAKKGFTIAQCKSLHEQSQTSLSEIIECDPVKREEIERNKKKAEK